MNKKKSSSNKENTILIDSIDNHWVYKYLPNALIPYAQLARWERPIGWQLLMWPCWWSLLIASYILLEKGIEFWPLMKMNLWYLFLFFLGAFVMRGAGCTYNDLVDHKLDESVERTKSRPLPAKKISRKQAKYFLILQLFVGLFVLLQFNRTTIFLGFSSLIFVALYPFMKRITHWPQLILGCAFNWGSLLGWSAVLPKFSAIPIFLYCGSICWTIGYDTIYAYQDRDDDKVCGIKSTALFFAGKTIPFLLLFYFAFLFCFFIAFQYAHLPIWAYIFLFFVFCHLLWQIMLFPKKNYLKIFRSNHKIGILITLGLCVSIFLMI